MCRQALASTAAPLTSPLSLCTPGAAPPLQSVPAQLHPFLPAQLTMSYQREANMAASPTQPSNPVILDMMLRADSCQRCSTELHNAAACQRTYTRHAFELPKGAHQKILCGRKQSHARICAKCHAAAWDRCHNGERWMCRRSAPGRPGRPLPRVIPGAGRQQEVHAAAEVRRNERLAMRKSKGADRPAGSHLQPVTHREGMPTLAPPVRVSHQQPAQFQCRTLSMRQ